MTEAPKGRMWGGRFEQPVGRLFDEFQRSFGFDQRLLPYELAVDRAWTRALEAVGVLTADERQRLLAAIDHIDQRARTDPDRLTQSPAEDIHHFVESQLIEMLGPLGAKLHTGRSRNELIVTDFRMFVKDAARAMRGAVAELIDGLLVLAEQHLGLPMPGMTHLQHAQPILFSHFLLAHAEAFFHDLGRLVTAAYTSDACPMGSGALAGCAFPIDRQTLAKELGFARITRNSLDSVSRRDFALDYLYALAVLANHLSRLAEDFVLFASQEFGFVELPDEYSTGSSLMPQKKNPDAWELIRGKAGRVTAALSSLLMMLKGLPTGYQRDLQEDKEALFGAHDQTLAMVHVARGALSQTRIRVSRMREAAADPALLATEAADYLVARGVPFRQAHEIIGAVIREAERCGQAWTALRLETLKRFSPAFESDWHREVTLESALARRRVPGGTAPEAVDAAIADCRARLRQIEVPG